MGAASGAAATGGIVVATRRRHARRTMPTDTPRAPAIPEPRFLVDAPAPRPEKPPPSAERVARRARVLALVVLRGTSEHQQHAGTPRVEALNEKLRRELARLELDGELEDEERTWMAAPAGSLSAADANLATWRSEGLVYLAWALGLIAMPPHDEMADVSQACDALGVFAPPVTTTFELRLAAELQAMHLHQLGLAWRLRDFRVRPRAMDFAAFSRRCWFGSFELRELRLVDGDLAVGQSAIAAADPRRVRMAEGIAVERRRASLWLAGHDPSYAACEPWT
jgi:hypothetical protein